MGAVPSRKSKSQPSSACLTCCGENRAVAALVFPRRGLPGALAPLHLFGRNLQIQHPPLHVELDQVAVLHAGERAADEGLRRDVQHAAAVARAAHARIRDAHHVAHALLEELLRHRQHAPFGHARARRAGRRCAARAPSRRRRRGRRGRCARPCRCSRRTPLPCRCASRSSVADALITAPLGARLPRSTTRPPDSLSGFFLLRMTSSL